MGFLKVTFGLMLGFFAVLGVGVAAFGLSMTGGGVEQDNLAVVKEGVGKAYVSGLKGVEQTARRLRGDYCAGERAEPKSANCG
jgi:hypothetical protein